MCGRYFFAENLANEEYLKLLERKYDQLVLDLWSRNEVYPGTLCVTETDSGAELMNWGLPLFSRNMINSRLESIMEKNYYRDIFHSGRCIIPASGFYEWDGHKQKHYIHTD
ncbi:MAG: SOS response-associated peptidase family protein, partial [Erysipelotrichaceae bacterium]|nr:SOS response-associated peptidase family protein [Erysipelotrichaceae bacterium]